MANRLEMAMIQAILQLHAAGWSQRAIARRLSVDRETVAKALRAAQRKPKPANAPSGSEGAKPATFPSAPALEAPLARATAALPGELPSDRDPKPAIAPPGSDAGIRGTIDATAPTVHPPEAADITERRLGRPSACEPFRPFILAMLEQELSAQRIYQDLRAEQGYRGSYYSVRRFVQKLEARLPLPMRRMECPPGFEAQVDYGTGAPVVTAPRKRRTTHVFRIVLSHSRKGYSEASFRQTTEDFIGALENAFWKFGGVPRTIVIDNLKAAVTHADWYDPELTPKLRAFCEHYGTAILPTRPYMPRHKGKVERGVAYVKENALKGRTFTSLEAQNRHLADWEAAVADTRMHGTTRQHVGEVFAEVERSALRPLPAERFPFFHEGQRIVNRDGHIEVGKAHYSVPPEYLGRTVWVRWDTRVVRVFNDRMQQITLHARHEPGRFSTQGAHIAAKKISGVERGARWLMTRVSLIGPSTTAWAEAMLTARGIEGTRVLLGLIALTKKHSSQALESACRAALAHGEFRLRAIRKLIARQPERVQAALPFLEEHPLIRPLDDYARVVASALQRRSDAAAPRSFTRHDSGVPCQLKEPNPGSDRGSDASGTRLRSGYPSPGCSSAEPGSVSPDSSSVRPLFPPLPGESSDDE